MKIYGRTSSFNVQKVMWLIEELDLEAEHTQLGGRFGGLDTAAFERLNPMKKVPVLEDGDKAVWESHTILRYLIACYGNKMWNPDCAYQRSLYERWLDWSQTVFQPAFMSAFWGYYRTPEDKRDMAAVNQALAQCRYCLDQLDNALEDKRYLAADVMTLADIAVGAVLYRLTEMGLSVTLPPNVQRWYVLLKERPGYKKWIMSDFTELKGRQTY